MQADSKSQELNKDDILNEMGSVTGDTSSPPSSSHSLSF